MEETVSCFCDSCSAELGQFRNAWNVIGSNYYSPVYPILTYEDGFVGVGDVRSVKLGNHEPCSLQDLKCKSCRTYLGIRCDSAPPGHILKRNQYLLRMSEITSLVAGTNKPANISVKSTFILESSLASSKKSKSRAPSMEPSRSKSMGASSASVRRASSAMPPPLTPASKMNNTAASQFTSKPTEPMSKSVTTSSFEVWAEKEIRDQRSEITAITGAVERIQSTMDEFKSFMIEMGEQRATDEQQSKEAKIEVTRQHEDEVKELKKQIDVLNSTTPKTIDELKRFFTRQLLGESNKLGERVHRVEVQATSDVKGLKQTMSDVITNVLSIRTELGGVQENVSNLDEKARTAFAKVKVVTDSLSSALKKGDRKVLSVPGQSSSSLRQVPPQAANARSSGVPSQKPSTNTPIASVQRADPMAMTKITQAGWALSNYYNASQQWVAATTPSQHESTVSQHTIQQAQAPKRVENAPTSYADDRTVARKSANDANQNILPKPSESLTSSATTGTSKRTTMQGLQPTVTSTPPDSVQITGVNPQPTRAAQKTAMKAPFKVQPRKSSILRVEIPAFQPKGTYARVLSSPEDSSSDDSSSIESIPATADKRKRPLSSSVEGEIGDLKRRKRTSRSSNVESVQRSVEQSIPLALESPEPDISDTEVSATNKTSPNLSTSHISKNTSRQIRQIVPVAEEVSMLNSAAKRPVSAYGSSYHSSSNQSVSKPNASIHNKTTPRNGLPRTSFPSQNISSSTKSTNINTYNRNAVLPSVEANSQQPLSNSKLVESQVVDGEGPTPEQISRPYKCGACEKRFSSAHLLKSHKAQDRRCNAYTNRDSIPLEFVCSGCKGSFTSLGLFNNHDCSTTVAASAPPPPTAEEIELQRKKMEEQTRVLARRDQLVRETMEREMGF